MNRSFAIFSLSLLLPSFSVAQEGASRVERKTIAIQVDDFENYLSVREDIRRLNLDDLDEEVYEAYSAAQLFRLSVLVTELIEKYDLIRLEALNRGMRADNTADEDRAHRTWRTYRVKVDRMTAVFEKLTAMRAAKLTEDTLDDEDE